jgi:hypothetical protein
MLSLNALRPGRLTLLAGSSRFTSALLQDWIVSAAFQGPLRILIAGSRYPLYPLNYQVAARGGDYEHILETHVRLLRAETAYQVTAALGRTRFSAGPFFVFDLLTNYVDADIPEKEANSLFADALKALKRIKRKIPVVVSAAPHAARPRLFAALMAASDHTEQVLPPVDDSPQLRLWD